MLLAQLRQENLELRARLADVEGVSTAASLLEVGFIFSCGLRTGLPPHDEMQSGECCIVSCGWMAAEQQPPVNRGRRHSNRFFDWQCHNKATLLLLGSSGALAAAQTYACWRKQQLGHWDSTPGANCCWPALRHVLDDTGSS